MKTQNKIFSSYTISECYDEINTWSISKALIGHPAHNIKIKKTWKNKKNMYCIKITYTN